MKNTSGLMRVSFLLALILTSATVSVYGSGVELVTFLGIDIPGAVLPVFMLPGVIPLTLIAYAVCYFTDKHRLAGTFLTIGYLVVLMRIIGVFMLSGRRASGMFFQEWMLTRGDEVGMVDPYFIALILASSAFFGITVYYFTMVQYRVSFLTLVSLMPCVLYAKIIAEIDNIYVILIAAGNIALHMTRAKYDRRRRNMYQTKGTTLAVHGAFAGAMLLLVALLPKDESAPFYDRFEDLFLGGDTTSALSGDYSSLNEYSGNADNYTGEGNRRMYSLYGDTFTYLKRQNYDYYDFEMDRWSADASRNAPALDPTVYAKDARYLRLDALQAAVRAVAEADPSFAERYHLSAEALSRTISDRQHTLRIHAENFGAVYYLSASRAISVMADKPYRATTAGNFYLEDDDKHDPEADYDLLFYDTASLLNDWTMTGLVNYDDETAQEMLKEVHKALQKNTDADRAVQRFREALKDAASYRDLVAENTAMIPDDVRELAMRITMECTYDWQKAAAIEAYFRNNGFVYDLTYRAPDNSVSYFLFESKTGTCSDYATAFVLMARAAGLTARYTEGFLPEIASREGSYLVRERDSHAFPEVFLPNTGWVVFEPTVSAFGAGTTEETFLDYLRSMRVDLGLAGSLIIALGLIILIVLFCKVLLPAVLEGVFRLRLLVTRPEKAMPAAYRHLLKLAAPKRLQRRNRGAESAFFSGGARTDAMTMREFGEKLRNDGCDIGDFLSMLESMTYTNDGSAGMKGRDILSVYLKARSAIIRSLRAERKGSRAVSGKVAL